MKKTLKITVAAVALAASFTAPAALAGDKPNDLVMAHIAYTADDIDIRYGHLALALSKNETVRSFASAMVNDHAHYNDEALALLKKLGANPQDNPISHQLLAGADAKVAEFVRLEGKAFDCAYAKNEVDYHIFVTDTVEKQFIPNIENAEFKKFLADALVVFEQHEDAAEAMLSELHCG